ncbi:hypothetical protein Q9966_016682 [Columba livia]|nr:hypothetical protein Q9966_016682 [Columba livia]
MFGKKKKRLEISAPSNFEHPRAHRLRRGPSSASPGCRASGRGCWRSRPSGPSRSWTRPASPASATRPPRASCVARRPPPAGSLSWLLEELEHMCVSRSNSLRRHGPPSPPPAPQRPPRRPPGRPARPPPAARTPPQPPAQGGTRRDPPRQAPQVVLRGRGRRVSPPPPRTGTSGPLSGPENEGGGEDGVGTALQHLPPAATPTPGWHGGAQAEPRAPDPPPNGPAPRGAPVPLRPAPQEPRAGPPRAAPQRAAQRGRPGAGPARRSASRSACRTSSSAPRCSWWWIPATPAPTWTTSSRSARAPPAWCASPR